MSIVPQIRAMLASGLSIEQALDAADGIERGARPKRASRKDAKATRLPDDWQPDRDLAQFAMDEIGDRALCRRETDRFKDYWKGQPGSKGCKLDWAGTYRNWIRRAAERLPRRPGSILPPARQNGSDSLINALDSLVPRR